MRQKARKIKIWVKLQAFYLKKQNQLEVTPNMKTRLFALWPKYNVPNKYILYQH